MSWWNTWKKCLQEPEFELGSPSISYLNYKAIFMFQAVLAQMWFHEVRLPSLLFVLFYSPCLHYRFCLASLCSASIFFTSFNAHREDLLLWWFMSAGTLLSGACSWSQAKGCLQAKFANMGQSSRSFCRTIISTAGLDRKLLPLDSISMQLGLCSFTMVLLS